MSLIVYRTNTDVSCNLSAKRQQAVQAYREARRNCRLAWEWQASLAERPTGMGWEDWLRRSDLARCSVEKAMQILNETGHAETFARPEEIAFYSNKRKSLKRERKLDRWGWDADICLPWK